MQAGRWVLAPVRRAINVQLARVARGQPRLLQPARIGGSAARSGVAAPFPKLTIQDLIMHHQSPLISRSGEINGYPALPEPCGPPGDAATIATAHGLEPRARASRVQEIRLGDPSLDAYL